MKENLALSSDWRQPTLKSTPVDGQKNPKVTVCYDRCSDLSKKCFNPSEIDIEALIKAGVTLDPKAVATTFNITDIADIEAMRGVKSTQVFDYVEKNKDAILASIKKVEFVDSK